MRRLIINADDFGLSHETVNATIECFERRALTSATIMAKMPATNEAIQYAVSNPQFSFGVHLTWVGNGIERPLSPPERVPTLIDAEGRLLDTNTVRKKALKGSIAIQEIELEAKAQIALLAESGIKVSHVDSHGHVHKLKPFQLALRRILPQFGIRRMRSAQNVYLHRPFASPTYWLGEHLRRRIARHFISSDYFYMCTSTNDKNWVEELLDRPLMGTMEVGVHPGHAGDETWRVQEGLAAVRLRAGARKRGIRLITWHEV